MLFAMALCAVIIFSGIFANRFLNALGIPALLFFLCLGMIFGSDGIFKIQYDNFEMTKNLCSITLGFIIFYGGFCTRWETAKPIAVKAAVLSTAGVFATAALVCVFCHYILNVGFWESFLIGAVIGSTDAASVFSILKSKNLNLKDSTAPLLEIESGSNDPMSYILVILAITILQGQSPDFVFILFLKQLIIGILAGCLIARFGIYIFNKTKLISGGNDNLFIIALVLAAYAIPEFLQGNPFLSVYFLGIILGNANIKNKPSMLSFFDGITRLGQIGIFFILGLLAFPKQAAGMFYTGALIFLFLTFIARPIAIFALLLPFRASMGQCLLVSWAGLRGVASIVFAIIAIDSGLNLPYDLFHIVFFISILSVALQGTFLPWVSKITNMIDEHSDVRKTFNDYQEDSAIKLIRLNIPEGHPWAGHYIKDLDFPDDGIVILVTRGEERIIPNGCTTLQQGDTITLSLPNMSFADNIELKEFTVDKNNNWVDKKIKDICLESNSMIIAIRREGKNIIPRGNTKILLGDVIVMYN